MNWTIYDRFEMDITPENRIDLSALLDIIKHNEVVVRSYGLLAQAICDLDGSEIILCSDKYLNRYVPYTVEGLIDLLDEAFKREQQEIKFRDQQPLAA